MQTFDSAKNNVQTKPLYFVGVSIVNQSNTSEEKKILTRINIKI
jgi:hypothetical protein